MTTNGIDKVEFYLSQFQETMDDLEHEFPNTDVFGDVRARSPVVYRYKIYQLLRRTSEESIANELLAKSRQLNNRFDQFIESRGEAYIQALFDELNWFIDRYPQMICNFMRLDPVNVELSETLDRRDTMEILLLSFKNKSKYRSKINEDQIEEAIVKVEVLDEVFQCEFKKNLEEILNNHSHITTPYLPDDFWWRHPKSIE